MLSFRTHCGLSLPVACCLPVFCSVSLCFLLLYSDLSFPHCLFLLSSSLLFFSSFSKCIKVRIIDDEEYEKNKTFYVEMGEPRLMETNDSKGGEDSPGGYRWGGQNLLP